MSAVVLVDSSSSLDRLLLSDALDPLRHGSDLQGVAGSKLDGGWRGPEGGRKGVVNSADLKATCSISYADARMSALAELDSPTEYRSWLATKVKYMAQQGNKVTFFSSNNDSINEN